VTPDTLVVPTQAELKNDCEFDERREPNCSVFYIAMNVREDELSGF
jgi:hypothetical protein